MIWAVEVWNPGTGDMIKRCRDDGLEEPEFALTDGFVVTVRRKPELAFKAVGGITGEVTGEVGTKFRHQVLNPLIDDGLLEMTIPYKPTSIKQKYRLTEKGRALLKKQTKEAGEDEK